MDLTQPLLPFVAQMMVLGLPLFKSAALGQSYNALLTMLGDTDECMQFSAYLQEVDRVQAAGLPLHGLAHITGGGLLENVPRVLPEHLAAEIELQSWTLPPLFRHLVEWSGMQGIEPYRVLNMGIGMVCIVPADGVRAYTELLPESVVIGRLVPRQEQAIRLV